MQLPVPDVTQPGQAKASHPEEKPPPHVAQVSTGVPVQCWVPVPPVPSAPPAPDAPPVPLAPASSCVPSAPADPRPAAPVLPATPDPPTPPPPDEPSIWRLQPVTLEQFAALSAARRDCPAEAIVRAGPSAVALKFALIPVHDRAARGRHSGAVSDSVVDAPRRHVARGAVEAGPVDRVRRAGKGRVPVQLPVPDVTQPGQAKASHPEEKPPPHVAQVSTGVPVQCWVPVPPVPPVPPAPSAARPRHRPRRPRRPRR